MLPGTASVASDIILISILVRYYPDPGILHTHAQRYQSSEFCYFPANRVLRFCRPQAKEKGYTRYLTNHDRQAYGVPPDFIGELRGYRICCLLFESHNQITGRSASGYALGKQIPDHNKSLLRKEVEGRRSQYHDDDQACCLASGENRYVYSPVF